MDTRLLRNIRNTLNQIEVRGRENLDMLLGCILTIDNAVATDDQEKAQEEREGGVDDDQNQRGENV